MLIYRTKQALTNTELVMHFWAMRLRNFSVVQGDEGDEVCVIFTIILISDNRLHKLGLTISH